MNEFYSLRQVIKQKLAPVGKAKLIKAIEDKKLPAIQAYEGTGLDQWGKPIRRWKIRRSDLEAYIATFKTN